MKLTHPNSDLEIEVADGRAAQMYQSQGWREATVDAPKGNATLEEWQEFALAKGLSADDIQDKTRDELRAALS